MRLLERILYCLLLALLSSAPLNAQQSSSEKTAQPEQQYVPTNPSQKWVVRDPRTGRLYQRELRTVQQTVQQIVQTEIPQPAVTRSIAPPQIVTPAANYAYAAPGRQPLIRIPILAKQQIIPWPTPAGSNFAKNSSQPTNLFSGVLPNPSQAMYSAPLNIASPAGRTALRDSLQVGMPATVLR